MVRDRNPSSNVVKATLLAAGVMAVFGGATMAPALPSIRTHFSAVPNIDYLSRFVLTLPALMIAVMAPAAGYLVDRIGRMRVLVVSLLIAGLAGTSGYFVTTLPGVLAGRALLGVAVAGIMTSGTTLIADYYTGDERGRLLGLQTGFMGLGGTILLMVSGLLADRQWNTAFLIHLAAIAVLPFVLLYLYEPSQENRCQEDSPPAGEPGVCAGESEIRGNRLAVTPATTKAVPVKLLAFIYLLAIFVQINFYIVPLYLPFYLDELLGASATQSAGAIAFMSMSFSLSAILLGKTLSRQDPISVIIGSFVVLGTGYGLISLGTATPGLYTGLVIVGIGLGMIKPSLYVWLAKEVPVAVRGRVLGGFTTAIFFGQFLSPLLSQPLIDVYNLSQTMLLAGGVFILLVPLLFAGRGRLRQLAAA